MVRTWNTDYKNFAITRFSFEHRKIFGKLEIIACLRIRTKRIQLLDQINQLAT